MRDEDGSVMLLGLLAGYLGKTKSTFQIFVLHCLSKIHPRGSMVLCLSTKNLEPALCASPGVLSHVRLFATPGTVAHQAYLSTEFSRQEYWSGLLPVGFLLHGFKSWLCHFLAL